MIFWYIKKQQQIYEMLDEIVASFFIKLKISCHHTLCNSGNVVFTLMQNICVCIVWLEKSVPRKEMYITGTSKHYLEPKRSFHENSGHLWGSLHNER